MSAAVRRAARLGAETAAAAARLAVIEAGLRRSTVPALCRRLGIRVDVDTATAPRPGPAVLPRWAATPVRACLAVTARWPAGDTCLRRCLLVGHRLRALDPVLRIGVRRDGAGRFGAHAWLEIDGRTLDGAAGRFTTLGGPPGPGPS